MKFNKAIPKAKTGILELEIDEDITAGSGIWIKVPSRIQTVTTAVNIPKGQKATFTIEKTFNCADTIGTDGTGGYWRHIIESTPIFEESTDVTVTNGVSAIRVTCISADSTINVCVRG